MPQSQPIKPSRLLPIQQIKQIVQKAVQINSRNHPEKISTQTETRTKTDHFYGDKSTKNDNQNFRLFSQLLAKKKIVMMNRLQKVRKQMKIFCKLEHYIDFEDIFHRIVVSITQKFYTQKKIKQSLIYNSLNPSFNNQLFFQQIQKIRYKNQYKYNQTIHNIQPYNLASNHQHPAHKNVITTIKQLNHKIQSEYGAKFCKIFKMQAQNIQQFLQQVKKQGNGEMVSAMNRDFFITEYFKRTQEQDKYKDNYNQLTMLDGMESQGRGNVFFKKFYFDKKDHMELQGYYRQALTYLSLAIEGEKKKSNFITIKQNKIKAFINNKSKDIFNGTCPAKIQSFTNRTNRTYNYSRKAMANDFQSQNQNRNQNVQKNAYLTTRPKLPKKSNYLLKMSMSKRSFKYQLQRTANESSHLNSTGQLETINENPQKVQDFNPKNTNRRIIKLFSSSAHQNIFLKQKRNISLHTKYSNNQAIRQKESIKKPCPSLSSHKHTPSSTARTANSHSTSASLLTPAPFPSTGAPCQKPPKKPLKKHPHKKIHQKLSSLLRQIDEQQHKNRIKNIHFSNYIKQTEKQFNKCQIFTKIEDEIQNAKRQFQVTVGKYASKL